MDDKKVKHLEMIQGIISRMAQNSFMIKGWCITLGVLVFALVGEKINLWYSILLIVPTILFGLLDTYYLMIEKRYRELYERVAKKNEKEIDFLMNLNDCKNSNSSFCKSLASISIWLFYTALVILEFSGIVIINGGFC